MTLVRSILDSIDWSTVDVLGGSGTDLKNALVAFLEADAADMDKLWWGLEGSAFAQNTIYGASVVTVDVMMAALADDPPQFRRDWILEVLRFILTGGSIELPELSEQCRSRAERGFWLLAAELSRLEDPIERQPLEEIMQLIDPALFASVNVGLGR